MPFRSDFPLYVITHASYDVSQLSDLGRTLIAFYNDAALSFEDINSWAPNAVATDFPVERTFPEVDSLSRYLEAPDNTFYSAVVTYQLSDLDALEAAGYAVYRMDNGGALRGPGTPTYITPWEDMLDRSGVRRDLVMDMLGGDDWAYGGRGDDRILGRAGEDHLFGGNGADTILGHGGLDVIEGGGGDDRILGGGGGDQIYADNGNDRVKGGSGNDFIDGGRDRDVLEGGGGNDHILGGAGRDRIYGGAGNDILEGVGNGRGAPGDAADRIFGGAGDDEIYGSSNGDLIVGGRGDDLLDPGGGADVLLFVAGESGNDTIRFYHSDDVIRISGATQRSVEVTETFSGSTRTGAVIEYGRQGDTITIDFFLDTGDITFDFV